MAIENKRSNRNQIMTYLQGECSCSCRRVDSIDRFSVSRVVVLNDPPASSSTLIEKSIGKYTVKFELVEKLPSVAVMVASEPSLDPTRTITVQPPMRSSACTAAL